MFTGSKNSRSFTYGRAICLLYFTSALFFCLFPAGSTARLFSGKTRKQGGLLLDIDFDMTVVITDRASGVDLDSKRFTEEDVDQANLWEDTDPNFRLITLRFLDDDGLQKAGLTFSFIRQTPWEDADFFTIDHTIDITPGSMFPWVKDNYPWQTSLPILFDRQGQHSDIFIDSNTSYVCDKPQTEYYTNIEFEQLADDFRYRIKMETSYFHAQAFNVKKGKFSRRRPRLCSAADIGAGKKAESPTDDHRQAESTSDDHRQVESPTDDHRREAWPLSHWIALYVGAAIGCLVVVGLTALTVGFFIRRSQRKSGPPLEKQHFAKQLNA